MSENDETYLNDSKLDALIETRKTLSELGLPLKRTKKLVKQLQKIKEREAKSAEKSENDQNKPVNEKTVSAKRKSSKIKEATYQRRSNKLEKKQKDITEQSDENREIEQNEIQNKQKKSAESSPKNDQLCLDEEIYEVEKICSARITNNIWEYEVKWVGFPEKENTYEPEENLKSCPKKLEDYKLRWGSDKKSDADKLKDEKLILAKNSADDPILYSSIIETVKITDRAPSDIIDNQNNPDETTESELNELYEKSQTLDDGSPQNNLSNPDETTESEKNELHGMLSEEFQTISEISDADLTEVLTKDQSIELGFREFSAEQKLEFLINYPQPYDLTILRNLFSIEEELLTNEYIDGKLDEIEDGLEKKCFSVAELTVRQFEIDFLTIIFDRKSEDELMHEISNLLT